MLDIMRWPRDRDIIYDDYQSWVKEYQVDVGERQYSPELGIWKDSASYSEIHSKDDMNLKKWFEWKVSRLEEDQLIVNAFNDIPRIKQLIDIDARQLGVSRLFHEKSIRYVMGLIKEFINSSPEILLEFQSIKIDSKEWAEYESFQNRALDEYIRTLRNNYKKLEYFLDHRIDIDDLIYKKFDIHFNIDDMRKLEIWTSQGNILKWDEWVYGHCGSWGTLVKHGYSLLYQEVWWAKHLNISYDRWRNTNIDNRIDYSAEFKRQLILKKLRELRHAANK